MTSSYKHDSPASPKRPASTHIRYLVNFGNITTLRSYISLNPLPTLSSVLDNASKQLKLPGIGALGEDGLRLEYASISMASPEPAVSKDEEGMFSFLSFYSEDSFKKGLGDLFSKGIDPIRITVRVAVDDEEKAKKVVMAKDRRRL